MNMTLEDVVASIDKEILRSDFKRAAYFYVKYRGENKKLSGLNTSWDENAVISTAAYLSRINQSSPKVLSALTFEELEKFRYLAIMHYLLTPLGYKFKWVDIPTLTKYDNLSIIKLILSGASPKKSFDPGPPPFDGLTLKIVVYNNNDDRVCEYCWKMKRTKFTSLDDLPELPFEGCTSETGCRCSADAYWSILND
jgi:hypothetical protein